MKVLPAHKEILGTQDKDQVFQHLMDTLSPGITTWQYFVNWEKVHTGYSRLEESLNLLNMLVGKTDAETELRNLLQRHPQVIEALPILIATRHTSFRILTDFDSMAYLDFSFERKGPLSPTELDKIVAFARGCGVLSLLENRTIKSLPDYVLGVEVGLDSNGRKNRGGSIMEDLIEVQLSAVCKKRGYDYVTQATAASIRERWAQSITVDKSAKRIDFAVWTGSKLFLLETNFYNGGGSKLKATAGEYKDVSRTWRNDGHEFVWVTDGFGWKTAHLPLREAFEEIDHVLNLDMCRAGLLDAVLTS